MGKIPRSRLLGMMLSLEHLGHGEGSERQLGDATGAPRARPGITKPRNAEDAASSARREFCAGQGGEQVGEAEDRCPGQRQS